MPEETCEALKRSERARRGLTRFVGVPDSWEGWAIRILTVAVILTLATQAYLGALLVQVVRLTEDQNTFMRDSRTQRTQFQLEETRRQCEILRDVGATGDELKAQRC